jgi:hypothetical protein
MAGELCSCGFAPAGDETLTDHLLEVFAVEDGTAADGLVHLEGEVSLFCMCGTGGCAEELDAHFLTVFIQADSIGRDGVKHEPAPLFEWPALVLASKVLLKAEGGPFTAVRPWMTSVAVGRMMVGACTPPRLRRPRSEARSSM